MFERERHAVDVEYKGKAYRFYARELGYIHFQEICGAKYSEPHTLNLLKAVVLASAENENGSQAFTAETWRDAPQVVADAISGAVMKAQGIKLQEEKQQEAPEGNV